MVEFRLHVMKCDTYMKRNCGIVNYINRLITYDEECWLITRIGRQPIFKILEDGFVYNVSPTERNANIHQFASGIHVRLNFHPFTTCTVPLKIVIGKHLNETVKLLAYPRVPHEDDSQLLTTIRPIFDTINHIGNTILVEL